MARVQSGVFVLSLKVLVTYVVLGLYHPLTYECFHVIAPVPPAGTCLAATITYLVAEPQYS